jgi:hypothetical protein
MTRTRIITYPTNVNWPTLAELQPQVHGEHPPPLVWPDAPAASIETLNAIAHELAHELP